MINRAGSGAETWRVGVLFSRSGVMEVTETEHFFGTALAIQEINQSGGILGREIEVVAYDPGSDPETYRKLADRLLTEDGISVIFGCSTSAARKAVLPAIERRNGLLWYPSLYEGFEYSPNVIYTGASPNQNSFPLAEYLVRNYGSAGVSRRLRLCLSARIQSDHARSRRRLRRRNRRRTLCADGSVGVAVACCLERVREQQPDVLFSTVVGRPAQNFYRLYHDAGFDAAQMPIASLTIAEGEIREIGAEFCAGHITAATYFGSLDSDSNRTFVTNFHRLFGAAKPISMWSAGAYAQVRLFALALEIAGTLDTQRLVDAALGLAFEAPEGSIRIDPENNHTWLTPRIGKVRRDGGFDIVWEAKSAVKPDPYLAVTPLGSRWISDGTLAS